MQRVKLRTGPVLASLMAACTLRTFSFGEDAARLGYHHDRFLVDLSQLPWVSVVDIDSGPAYSVAVDTPDDAMFRCFKLGEHRPPLIEWMRQLSRFGYPRRLICSFTADGGYVALAKAFRRIVLPDIRRTLKAAFLRFGWRIPIRSGVNSRKPEKKTRGESIATAKSLASDLDVDSDGTEGRSLGPC